MTQFIIISSFVRPAIRSSLIIFAPTPKVLIDPDPKSSIGGSLKPLSLSSALLFLIFHRRCATRYFLISKLHTKVTFLLLLNKALWPSI